jgi:pimeloyl-ACP methyl ester carboxylesterase
MVFIGAAIPTPQEPIAGLFASAPEAITIPLLAQAIDDTGRFKFSWETARDFFYHDIPEEEAKAAWSRLRPQDPTIFTEPCPIAAWPSVPSTYVAMTDDRAMNPAWWSRLAVERLGADVVELPGSHSPFLSRPAELIKILASV